MKNWWMYVLKLEQGKYYVGITSQTPEIRMQEHLRGIRPANWTKEYKPLEIVESKRLGLMKKEQAEDIENKRTRELIKQYGLNNVRGGDLRLVDSIVIRFGRIYKGDDWEALTTIIFLLLVIVLLAIRYILNWF